MRRTILIISLIFLGTVPFKINEIGLAGTVPNTMPRYISLAPSTTEILFALGLDEEIVGVSTFCNYPQKAKTKEKIGTFSQPNIEKILSLKPQIIFCTGLEQSDTVQKLKNLNLKVYVSDPANTEDLLNSIREIGKLTGREKAAEELITKIKTEINEITLELRETPQEKRPKVFLEFWNNPLMTAGKNSFIDELLRLSGGINIAADLNKPYAQFSPEEVIRRNPDCIIMAYMVNDEPAKEISSRPGWNKISAVKNKRIYADINPDILLRPGPRFAEGMKELHKRLYQK